MTFPEIGQLFGGVHHSAVSQAVRRVKRRVSEREDLQTLTGRGFKV